MVSARRIRDDGGSLITVDNGGTSYEEIRKRRIEENKERLHKLGILDLKSRLAQASKTARNVSTTLKLPKSLPLPDSARRSSRLKSMIPVNYSTKTKKESSNSKDLQIRIKEGSKPEIYDESHVKLLGDCKTAWTLSMDEYREDGKHIDDPEKGDTCYECRQETLEMSNSAPTAKTSPNIILPQSSPLSTSNRRSSRLRSVNPVNYSSFYTTIYDPEKRETCHHCRQELIGLHTHCSSCKASQGHFCGSCLFKRYGENVIEVKENASWVCPVCRGICNCSRCRKAKGWEPTGYISGKVLKLGFKSVAHYLILTQQVKTQPEDTRVEISESEETCIEKVCGSRDTKHVGDTDAFNGNMASLQVGNY